MRSRVLATTIQYQRFGRLCKVRENLEAGKFSVRWEPQILDYKAKPVLISCASIKCVQSWEILKDLQLYTSISLYKAFPTKYLSKKGLPLLVSLFLLNRGDLVFGHVTRSKLSPIQKSFCRSTMIQTLLRQSSWTPTLSRPGWSPGLRVMVCRVHTNYLPTFEILRT